MGGAGDAHAAKLPQGSPAAQAPAAHAPAALKDPGCPDAARAGAPAAESPAPSATARRKPAAKTSSNRKPRKQAFTAMGFPSITPTPARARGRAGTASPDENDAGAGNAGAALPGSAAGGYAATASGRTPAREPFSALAPGIATGVAGGGLAAAEGALCGTRAPDEGPRHGILATSSGAAAPQGVPHALTCSVHDPAQLRIVF